jgi:DNA-binding LytR/AlgR family response regulator
MAKNYRSRYDTKIIVILATILQKDAKTAHNPAQHKSRFFTQINHSIFCIPVEEVLCFIFEDGATILTTTSGRNYIVKYSLESLETLLDPQYFFRINRRCIANIDSFKKINILSKSRIELVLRNGSKEILSRSKNAAFKTWLDC